MMIIIIIIMMIIISIIITIIIIIIIITIIIIIIIIITIIIIISSRRSSSSSSCSSSSSITNTIIVIISDVFIIIISSSSSSSIDVRFFYLLQVMKRMMKGLACWTFGFFVIGTIWISVSSPNHFDRYFKKTSIYQLDAFHGFKLQSQEASSVPCVAKKTIALLKVHKAASTTICNILQRYGFYRHLLFALPAVSDYALGWPRVFSPTFILNIPKGENYSILANHAVYSKAAFESTMPSGTMYVGILREPFSQFLSAFQYYGARDALSVHGNNSVEKIQRFLEQPQVYMRRVAAYDKARGFYHLQNHQARDFGLNESDFDSISNIKKFISHIDENFHLILMKEHLDMSVILLRRLMCWKIQDVIYLPVLPVEQRASKPRVDVGLFAEQDKSRHLQWSRADYEMYLYFNKTFWKRVKEQASGFIKEVDYFIGIRKKIGDFCLGSPSGNLTISRTKWNEEFSITSYNCTHFTLDDFNFTVLLKKEQNRWINKRVVNP